MRKNTEEKIDYERAIAGALAILIERSNLGGMEAMQASAPGWVGEVLDALAPLKALAPGLGQLPTQEATILAQIQDALSRADLSKAAAATNPRRLYK